MDKTQLLKKLRQQLRQQRREIGPIATATSKKAIAVDDHVLFSKAMQGVVPLKKPAAVLHPPCVVSPWPKHQAQVGAPLSEAMSDFWPWDELEQGEQLLHIKPGQKLDTLRKLKRGEWPVDAELDLHGENIDSARGQVAYFIDQCQARRSRCVRIIHGKGLSSKDGTPVLKLKLKNWLAQMDAVLAFAQANPAQGCAGAVLVLLKTRKQ